MKLKFKSEKYRKQFKDEIRKALESVGEKHNVVFKLGLLNEQFSFLAGHGEAKIKINITEKK